MTALHNALWQLLPAPSLEEGITNTAMRSGDTDPNAAIAVVLLGAVYGLDAMPERWRAVILDCRPQEGAGTAHPRPRWFWPVDTLEFAALLVVSPEFRERPESDILELNMLYPSFTNSIGMEFIPIPPGSFTIGSADDDTIAYDNEKPLHTVNISKPFYLGKYEVTQAQWEKVMGNNPSELKSRPKHPVENVSWDDVQEFIQRLNQEEGLDRYRLPTEAEWEHAARAGSTSAFSFGDDAGQLERYAWYDESWNSGSTHPVGQKQPNAWCLYDMHGNVWELVQDWFGEYPSGPVTDPTGPSSSAFRVIRGGGWGNFWWDCRTAMRRYIWPDSRDSNLGFRLTTKYL